MAEYLSPGVYVEEFDNSSTPIQGISTSTAGFIGLAEKGRAVGAPVAVRSPADFTRKFGGYLQENEFGEYRYLAYAVQNFFANGGSRAYVMRVVPPDAETAKSVSVEGQEGIIEFKAKNPGSWGNSISVTFIETSKAKTQIFEDLGEGTYRVKNSSDFNAGDVVMLEGTDEVEYNIISSVDKKIITFESPFKADVVDNKLLPTITIKTCEMNVELRYDDSVEIYEFISLNVSNSNFIEKELSKSELVTVNAQANKTPVAPIDIVRKVFGSEKDVVKIVLKNGENGTADSLTDDDFIGVDKGPGSRTGIQSFLDNPYVNIMAVPGIVSANVQLSLVSHCENLGSRFAVLDIPKDSKTISKIMKHRDIVDSDYCAMYHPWLEVFDPMDKKNIYIPPSGSVMGIYARSDSSRGVHKAPANETVANCTGLYCNYNADEQSQLNPKGVNLIRQFPGAGIRVWGARTATSKPLWKYINVRRLFIYLEESIKANTNWVVFEPNDQLLWTRVENTISTFLENVWRTGALVGGSPEEAFFVDVGPNTMTQDDINNGRLICVIGVAPVKPAEFVIFRITQKSDVNGDSGSDNA